jgi:NAD(P)-dependent dehydrogenase (short-subunit alcohol dehydrogenase family)
MAITDDLRLDGKVALVTGASHGIGEEIAVAFAEQGAHVALAARTRVDLERVAERVRGYGVRALVVPVDVADLSSIETMVSETVRQLGAPDVLANVAGLTRRKPLLDVSLEDWNYVIDVNLRGLYFVTQAVGRYMVARGSGKIINIASMTSYRGFSGISLYGLTKAAVVQFTMTVAVEWAPHNVQANAIAPGWIETPMTATMMPERRAWVEGHVPQGKYGTPHDLSHMAVYLASAASNYVTGQTLAIDGGFLAGNPWP